MESLERILERLRDAESVFWILDYDGTLAPIVSLPEEAVPVPGVVELLNALVSCPGVRVAIVTGRTIADVRRFVDVRGVYYAGVHGLELEFPNGDRRVTHGTGLVDVVLPIIKGRIAHALGSRPGIIVEDKGSALAYHYRLASLADAVTTRQVLTSVVRRYQSRGIPVAINYGHDVAEVRPLGVNKGDAVRAFLSAFEQPPVTVCLGDDRTDADAFAALPPGSVAIHVGPTEMPRTADFWLPDPAAVLAFLTTFHEQRRDPFRTRSPQGECPP